MDDDDVRESEDDALEDTRADNYFNPATDEDRLPEDNDPPSAPPHNDRSGVNPQAPPTDAELDADEVYSEGLAAAEDRDKIEEDSDDAPAQPLDLEEEEE